MTMTRTAMLMKSAFMFLQLPLIMVDAPSVTAVQLTDDILVALELFPPIKAEALNYLDKGGKKPDR